jgi:hypothetical protein
LLSHASEYDPSFELDLNVALTLSVILVLVAVKVLLQHPAHQDE